MVHLGVDGLASLRLYILVNVHYVISLHRSSLHSKPTNLLAVFRRHFTMYSSFFFAYLSSNSIHWLRSSKLRLPKTKGGGLLQSLSSRYDMVSLLSHRQKLVSQTFSLPLPSLLERRGEFVRGIRLPVSLASTPTHRRSLV